VKLREIVTGILIYFIVLGLTVAFMDKTEGAYKEDKIECESWGRAFFIVASWRTTMSKVEAYDEVISKNSKDKEALSDAVRIVWVVYSTEDTDDIIKKKVYLTCMKERGHTGV